MLAIRYQGEDIYFGIQSDPDDVNFQNITAYNNIHVLLYTDTSYICKYSYQPESGYTTLTQEAANLMSGYITSAQSKAMNPGNITMEIRLYKANSNLSGGNENIIGITEVYTLRPAIV